ncbi:unnamed protein product [Aphanomyces euteiches]
MSSEINGSTLVSGSRKVFPGFMVASFCAVEIADVGNEGATYGLITTVANLTSPFASMIYKVIDSYLKLSQDNIRDDTTEVRWDVTYSYLISYGSKVFALTWLFLLPPQRVPLQELKRHGGKSKVAGALLASSSWSASRSRSRPTSSPSSPRRNAIALRGATAK